MIGGDMPEGHELKVLKLGGGTTALCVELYECGRVTVDWWQQGENYLSSATAEELMAVSVEFERLAKAKRARLAIDLRP